SRGRIASGHWSAVYEACTARRAAVPASAAGAAAAHACAWAAVVPSRVSRRAAARGRPRPNSSPRSRRPGRPPGRGLPLPRPPPGEGAGPVPPAVGGGPALPTLGEPPRGRCLAALDPVPDPREIGQPQPRGEPHGGDRFRLCGQLREGEPLRLNRSAAPRHL